MKITEEMQAESGGPLGRYADFEDDDGTGVKAGLGQERVHLLVDSYSFRCRGVWLTADDADGLADLLHAKAAELRKEFPDEPSL